MTRESYEEGLQRWAEFEGRSPEEIDRDLIEIGLALLREHEGAKTDTEIAKLTQEAYKRRHWPGYAEQQDD